MGALFGLLKMQMMFSMIGNLFGGRRRGGIGGGGIMGIIMIMTVLPLITKLFANGSS